MNIPLNLRLSFFLFFFFFKRSFWSIQGFWSPGRVFLCLICARSLWLKKILGQFQRGEIPGKLPGPKGVPGEQTPQTPGFLGIALQGLWNSPGAGESQGRAEKAILALLWWSRSCHSMCPRIYKSCSRLGLPWGIGGVGWVELLGGIFALNSKDCLDLINVHL